MAQSGMTDYQSDLISYVQHVMKAYEPERLKIVTGGRRHGKSQAARMMREAYTTQTTNRAAGYTGDRIILDEFAQLSQAFTMSKVTMEELSGALDDAIDWRIAHMEHDERWPGSQVEVREVVLNPRDPRNPNPSAGRQVRYEIRGKYTITETVQGLEFAKRRAKDLVQVAVKRIQEEQRKANPMFGRF